MAITLNSSEVKLPVGWDLPVKPKINISQLKILITIIRKSMKILRFKIKFQKSKRSYNFNNNKNNCYNNNKFSNSPYSNKKVEENNLNKEVC